MGIKLANNAFATLAAGINSSATSITVTSGQGARFPTLSAGDYFYATLIDTSNNLEIIKCTARSTDVLTVVRGQESTTARAYSAGDRIEIRLTAQTFLDAVNGQDGDKGDITVSGTGSVWTIDNNAVTAAKIANGAVTALKLGPGSLINLAYNSRAANTSINTTTWTDVWSLTYTPVSSSSYLYIWIHMNFWQTNQTGNGDAFMRLQVDGSTAWQNDRVAGNFAYTGSVGLHSHYNAMAQYTNSSTSTKTILLQGALAAAGGAGASGLDYGHTQQNGQQLIIYEVAR